MAQASTRVTELTKDMAEMGNPVLVEVTRGGAVESRHNGAVVVIDADGVVVESLGDINQPVFPRSAVKGVQALALIESGAADRLCFGNAEIALACSSHSGEPAHADLALRMLKAADRDERCLECGWHWPNNDAAARALAREGREPSALHNNCSGKHSGFVCAAIAMGADPAGYVKQGHRLQDYVTAALEDAFAFNSTTAPVGIDGCAIPTYGIPLKNLAAGFARFGTGRGFGPERAKAIRRIREACAAEPFFVAGTGKFDTRIMTALRAQAFTKTGAEGVYCAALPESGFGVAIKIDDGNSRASEVTMAAMLDRFLPLKGEGRAAVDAALNPTITNRNGLAVGEIRRAEALLNPKR